MLCALLCAQEGEVTERTTDNKGCTCGLHLAYVVIHVVFFLVLCLSDFQTALISSPLKNKTNKPQTNKRKQTKTRHFQYNRYVAFLLLQQTEL